MIKTLFLLKRKPGMSVAAFRDYYENRHAPLAESYLAGHVERYFRRYADAMPDVAGGVAAEPDYDVMTELWYADAAQYACARAILSAPDVAAIIRADEAQLFDATRTRMSIVQESESAEMSRPRDGRKKHQS